MFGSWDCCASSCSDSVFEEFLEDPKPFYLPSPLPQWPKGKDFASGKICLGELVVVKVTKFDKIWGSTSLRGKAKGVAFYKPSEIPDGYSCLGHYCQPSNKQLRGYVLVAKAVDKQNGQIRDSASEFPALKKPLNYSLIWSDDSRHDERGYIWLPNPPEDYKSMGFVVTTEPNEPEIEEVRCVRADLTEHCEVGEVIFDMKARNLKDQFYIWNTRACGRGMLGKGVPVGTFFCGKDENSDDELDIACLKNLDSSLLAMPNLEQVHALVKEYGPTLYFHPDEVYFPSSVSWFFENGALLFKAGRDKGLDIDSTGSNLPAGGENDKEFWLDLPVGDDDNDDNSKDYVKYGKIETSELYIHVKPASGGSFTDLAMWVFCPFNGPVTIKAGVWNYECNRLGQHVGDWEHYALRISNFTGELWSIYFSEHSGGEWLDASELEFIEGNKAVVYSSKHGHASFPQEGCYIQGSTKLGVGVRNDCAKSKFLVDSSTKYQIVAAEHLGDEFVDEPHWLQYMREWGPTVVYNSLPELEKIIKHLPFFIRLSVENLIMLFPTELYGEEGPTGPKEKDNWLGDERC